MDHPTTRPSNVSIDVKRERLKRDLSSLVCIQSVRDDMTARNGIVFRSEGSMPGDIPSDALRVLAEHGAFLPGNQPNDRRAHGALIHTQ